LPILQKVVQRLSEHGEVIKTQPSVLHSCNMHNNMQITQSLFPQSFLANSVPAARLNVWAVCIHKSASQWNQTRTLPLRTQKTYQWTHFYVTTDKSHTVKINLYERDAI